MTIEWRFGAVLALAMVLVAGGCDSGGGDGEDECEGGSTTAALGSDCTVPAGAAVTGRVEGRMAFSAADTTTYPLMLDLDIEAGEVDGTLSFSDTLQCYAGTLTGTVGTDGAVSGTWEARGVANGATTTGTFEGRMGATGGCGTWENSSGQGGPWKAGDALP